MSRGFALHIAPPASLGDCLESPLLALVEIAPPWIIYLQYGSSYLETINDDPEREALYDQGAELWAATVHKIIIALWQRFGGIPLALIHTQPSLLSRMLARPGAPATGTWEIERTVPIDPEQIWALTTFSAAPMIWSALPTSARQLEQTELALADLLAALRDGRMAWWASHGYKEAFLALSVLQLSLDQLRDLLAGATNLPVEPEPGQPFVPHRVRMHRRASGQLGGDANAG